MPVVNMCVRCCKFNKFISFFAINLCKTCSFFRYKRVEIHMPPVRLLIAVDNARVFHTVFHRFVNTIQFMAFYNMKSRLLHCERRLFIL